MLLPEWLPVQFTNHLLKIYLFFHICLHLFLVNLISNGPVRYLITSIDIFDQNNLYIDCPIDS